MCFDSKMVDDPKWLTFIALHLGEYYFCLAKLCIDFAAKRVRKTRLPISNRKEGTSLTLVN